MVSTKDDYACSLERGIQDWEQDKHQQENSEYEKKKTHKSKVSEKSSPHGEWVTNHAKKLDKHEITELEIMRCHHSL
jgi:hypothetical protein